MKALLIKFTKEELSKLDNFKRRIENAIDDYPDIEDCPDMEDCTYVDLRNFRESFEDIAKNTLKILDYITTAKLKSDIDNKENIEDEYTIITKYFSSIEYANLYYLKLCDEYDEVSWLRVPANQTAGIYKYKVKQKL